MQYPKRIPQHIMESESFKIFNTSIPSLWILREISERDYGVDCFVELVPSNGNLVGDIAFLQMKSTKSISWQENNYTFSGISNSTVNYWMGIQVPVFLCLVDLSARVTYFTNIKEQVRLDYDKFLDQKSFGFVFQQSRELNPGAGAQLFYSQYLRERHHHEFSYYFVSLLIHSQEYLDFIEMNTGRDFFMLVDEDQKLMMIHLFTSCEHVARQLGLEWSQMSIADRFQIDNKQYTNNPWAGDLHESTMTDILSNLRPVLIKALKKSIEIVTETESSYWLEKDRILFHYCLNYCDHIKDLKDN
jgi:Domain of unknown function (DUF4365)